VSAAAKLGRLVSLFSRVRVAVVGDLIADEFIYGRIERVSREAPVLILGYDSTELVPGGAGNAAANVAALGGRVSVIGVLGRDTVGAQLTATLSSRADVTGIIRKSGYVTPVKTRILAGGTHSAKQQVVRIDRTATAITSSMRSEIARRLGRAVAAADVVIVSDYGSGLVTPDVLHAALASCRGNRRPKVLVDSRYALADFRGITACTPNESEVEALIGESIGDNRGKLEQAGRDLLSRLESAAVLITRGSRGMSLFEPGRPTLHIPIVGSDQVADVTGAGDTVIATFALALGAGASFVEAAHLSNYAGGLSVMKRGTATVTPAELRQALKQAPNAPR
jgi:rfaE bifunctional protein kinase chain/domain